VKRVCVIGNSHTACLKLAWDDLQFRLPNIALTFFADRASGVAAMEPTNGGLIPVSDRVRKAISHTSGGHGVIDLRKYDSILVVGLTSGYPKFGYYSNAAARQAMLDHIPTTPAFTLVKKVRQTSEIPIFLVHQPLRKKGEDGYDDGGLPTYRQENGGVGAYRQIIGAINQELFQDMNAKLLEQPAQTITDCFYTRSEFGVDAVRLDLGGGNIKQEDDRAHMNARFGNIFLSTHLRAIAFQ